MLAGNWLKLYFNHIVNGLNLWRLFALTENENHSNTIVLSWSDKNIKKSWFVSILVSGYSHTLMGTRVINPQNGLCFLVFLYSWTMCSIRLVLIFISADNYIAWHLYWPLVNTVCRYLGIVSRSADILVEMLAGYHDYWLMLHWNIDLWSVEGCKVFSKHLYQ